MKKYIPLAVIIFLVIIAFTTGYYFLYFLPKTQKSEMLTKNQLSCSQLEDKVKSNYDKEYGFPGSIISYLDSSNHFNQKLQKCIVDISYDWSDPSMAYSEEYVVDAVENTKLMVCKERVYKEVETDTCTSNGKSVTLPQFNALEKEYMSQ